MTKLTKKEFKQEIKGKVEQDYLVHMQSICDPNELIIVTGGKIEEVKISDGWVLVKLYNKSRFESFDLERVEKIEKRINLNDIEYKIIYKDNSFLIITIYKNERG